MRRVNLFSLMPLVAALLVFVFPMPIQAQTVEWERRLATSSDTKARAVAASSSGIYVSGETDGVFPGQSNAGPGENDVFVSRFDNLGNQLWIRQFGSASQDTGAGVATDSTGIYVVGQTFGALTAQTNLGN